MKPAIRLGILKRLIELVLHILGRQGCSISVVVVSNSQIKRLNWRFLKHRYETDVLAFSMKESRVPGEAPFLGEVVISVEQAQKRAKEFGAAAQEELVRYVCHGILHLLGYQDKTAAQRNRMRLEENRLLRLLGPQINRIF